MYLEIIDKPQKFQFMNWHISLLYYLSYKINTFNLQLRQPGILTVAVENNTIQNNCILPVKLPKRTYKRIQSKELQHTIQWAFNWKSNWSAQELFVYSNANYPKRRFDQSRNFLGQSSTSRCMEHSTIQLVWADEDERLERIWRIVRGASWFITIKILSFFFKLTHWKNDILYHYYYLK